MRALLEAVVGFLTGVGLMAVAGFVASKFSRKAILG